MSSPWNGLKLVARSLLEKRVLNWTTPQIFDRQRQHLQKMIAWAKERSPFYAERLRHIDAANPDLSKIPPLNKSDLMTNFDRIVTDPRLNRAAIEEFMADPDRVGEWYLGEFAVARTSGTQGQKAIIVQNRAMLNLLFALQMSRASKLPATPLSAMARLFHRARLAVITIGPGFYPSAVALAHAPDEMRMFVDRLWIKHVEPLDDIVEELNGFQPNVLLGYANTLERLARESLAGRLRISKTDLRQIINISEPLSAGARRLIEDAFDAPVANNYSLGECNALSDGCPLGHGMHQNADWAVLEVVDADYRPVPPGTPGQKVLITNLYNTVEPLIRYEVEDMVTMSPDPCPCGCPLPLIKSVEGRTDEVVWIRVGDHFRPVHPYVFVDVLDEAVALGFYQIKQVQRNRFVLTASPAPHRTLIHEHLADTLRIGLHRFGLADVIHVDVEITDEVRPDPRSGKLKRITSVIGPPQDMNPCVECAPA